MVLGLQPLRKVFLLGRPHDTSRVHHATGSTVVVWPFAARAQQPVMPVIGFINAGSAPQWAHLVASFRKGLQEVGYTEGQNVVIEYRWAEGQYDRLPTMAVDLVTRAAESPSSRPVGRILLLSPRWEPIKPFQSYLLAAVTLSNLGLQRASIVRTAMSRA